MMRELILTGRFSHRYGSRNLGSSRVEIQKGIKLAEDLAAALKVPIDTESMDYVKKVDTW